MDEDRYLRIAVEPMDALPEVLARVRGHGGRPVFLAIPASSPLFLTASEFRALRETVRAANANLIVVSDDRQRQDFANLFNLTPADDDAAAVAWVGGQSTAQAADKSAIDPALGRPRNGAGSGWAPRAEPVTPIAPAPAQPQEAPATEPPADTDATTAMVPVDNPVPLPEPAETRRRRRWPWIAAFLVLLLVVAAAAAGLPQATVTLTRERTPVTVDIPVTVLEPGQSSDDASAITVPGERRTANVNVTATLPATGERSVPDQPASGGISFANTEADPITLTAGTEFVSDGGVTFTLDADVTIPAASNSLSGNADGTVTASAGGTVGNLAQGALSGRHESGVFFSNRNGALSGGTDRTTTVVSEEDLARATNELEALLPGALADVLSQTSGETVAIVPGSVTHTGVNPKSSVEAGTEMVEFSISASTSATGLAFDPAAAQDALLEAALANTAPPDGQTIDTTNAEITFGAAANASPNITTATVLVWQVVDLDDAVVDALPDDLARKTVDEATETLSEIPGVESVSIDIQPDWLPSSIRDQMPIVPQRIKVREE